MALRIISRLLPKIGFHHVIMFICSIPIVLLSVLLAGCTSNGLNNVYLVALQYKNSSTSIQADLALVNPSIAEKVYNATQPLNHSIIEVRAGYRGLCLTRSDQSLICSNNAATLANIVKGDRNEGTADPLNLIWIAKNFKETIVFDGLIFIAVIMAFLCILLLLTFPGWHEETDSTGEEREVMPVPSRPVMHAAFGLTALGFIFGLVSILWQHINSSAAGTLSMSLSYGAIQGHVGTTAMVLGWMAVVCLGIVALALLIMIMSLRLIHQLTDGEESL